MATTRIIPMHIGKGRTFSKAISDIIDYSENPQKTDNGRLISSYGCDSRTADEEFTLAKRQYIQKTGRVRGADGCCLRCRISGISFMIGYMDKENAERFPIGAPHL